MASMSEGIRNVAHSAIDALEEVTVKLIDGGVAPKEALKVAAILTRGSVDKLICEKFERRSASNITQNIKSEARAVH
jgi:hypothetical protein